MTSRAELINKLAILHIRTVSAYAFASAQKIYAHDARDMGTYPRLSKIRLTLVNAVCKFSVLADWLCIDWAGPGNSSCANIRQHKLVVLFTVHVPKRTFLLCLSTLGRDRHVDVHLSPLLPRLSPPCTKCFLPRTRHARDFQRV